MSDRLLFSDIHFHTWPYGAASNEHGYNTRLWAQWMACQDMLNDVEEYGIKYAYFFGDLFHIHGTIPTQALVIAHAMFQALRDRGVKLRCIAGNHDAFDKRGLIHGLQWLPQEEIRGLWDDEGLLVVGMPYTDDEERLKAFLGSAGENQAPQMLMLHQGVAGVPMSSGWVLDERLTPDMIPDHCRAFTGHYHFHRAVTPNLTVVGNLTPLTWGDVDQQKGWVIWNSETGALEHRIQSRSPNFMSFTYEQDISDVQGNFVKYLTPVDVKEQGEIRDNLLKEGALTVEFPEVKIGEKTDHIRTGEDVTIEHIVKVFEEREMDDRRREVGVEVREGCYETPQP